MNEHNRHENRPSLSKRMVRWGAYGALGYIGLASVMYVMTPHEDEQPLEYKPEVVATAEQGTAASYTDTEPTPDDGGYLDVLAVMSGLGALTGYIVWQAHKLGQEGTLQSYTPRQEVSFVRSPEQTGLDEPTRLQFAAIAEHIVWNADGTIRG